VRRNPLELALNEVLEKHLVDLALVVARALMAYQFREIHHDLSSEVIKFAVTPSKVAGVFWRYLLLTKPA
jgi:formylmethanofuran dehydrogenase subunit B